MMIPEAWENHAEMDASRRAFYAFHSALMEPWDGPACVVFTDGTQIGAVLDRNGLRPSRYWVTDDGLVVLASEVGVLGPGPGHGSSARAGCSRAGCSWSTPTSTASSRTTRSRTSWPPSTRTTSGCTRGLIHLDDLPDREHVVHTHASVTRRQQVFGYTEEELRILLTPMANTGAEPIGSMGTDTPIAVLSDRPRLLFDYFSQLFAQVTNPPLDAIREELVTSLCGIDRAGGQPARAHAGVLPPGGAAVPGDLQRRPGQDPPHQPRRRHAGLRHPRRRAASTTSRAAGRRWPRGSTRSARRSPRRSPAAPGSSCSPTGTPTAELAPIPSLLLTAAIHHHLVREKTRTQVGLIVEAGDVREVHHVALLIGYGAAAVNPYLAMESVEDLARDGVLRQGRARAGRRQPGQGARQGRAEGDVQDGRLHGRLLHRCPDLRGGRPVPGRGGPLLHRHHLQARRHRARHDRRGGRAAARARPTPAAGIPPAHRELAIGGEYQWRREGEPHLFDPETVFRLQHSTRTGRYDVFKQYTARVDEQSERLMTLRGLFRFRTPSVRARADPDRRGRAGLRDRQAVLHRRDVLRLDQPGGARDPGDRDEPAGRASPTPARAARTPTASTTPSAARRSSRSPPAASA